MGMFDNIEYEADCEKCGEPLKDFQSKDGPCILDNLPPSQVDGFYTKCDHCGTWHTFIVHRTCVVDSIDVMTGPLYNRNLDAD